MMSPLEDVLREAGWLRRLALALTRDPDDAADVAQDVLIAAWRDGGPSWDRPARPWLATIARNLMRNQMRSRRRRVNREQVAIDRASDMEVISPEAIALRTELQRALAAALHALEEPYRTAVVLRHGDDLSSEEIARRLGVPAGTVRWRVKVGLEKLREVLDVQYGPRERWRAMLMGPAIGIRARKSLSKIALCVLGTFLLIAAWVRLNRREPLKKIEAPAVTSSSAGNKSVRLPSWQPSDPGTLAICIRHLRTTRLQTNALLPAFVRRTDTITLFRVGAFNSRAQAEIAPLVAQAMDKPENSELTHRVECRTWACRVSILAPWNSDFTQLFPFAFEGMLASLAKNRAILMGAPIEDPVNRRTLHERSVFFQLATPAPVPALTAPSTVSSCQNELRSAERTLFVVRHALGQDTSPKSRFAQAAIDETKSAEFRPLFQQVVRTVDLDVKCTATACRVRAPERRDGGTINWAEAVQNSKLSQRFRTIEHASDGTSYFALFDKTVARGIDVLESIHNKATASAVLQRCARETPAAGRLIVHLFVPGTDEENYDGDLDRVSVRYAGDLVNTPLGLCIADVFTTAINTEALPSNRDSGMLAGRVLRFPLGN